MTTETFSPFAFAATVAASQSSFSMRTLLIGVSTIPTLYPQRAHGVKSYLGDFFLGVQNRFPRDPLHELFRTLVNI